MNPAAAAIDAVLKRDRAVVLGGLVAIGLLAWAYMVYMAVAMENMDMAMDPAMPRMVAWGAVDLLMVFVMWAVMMVAMMVPSAAPMVLIFATINRKRRLDEKPFVPTSAFLLGYLIIWIVFSAAATFLQWGLHAAALLSPMMVSTSPIFGGALLVAAGIFQWTPYKHACLKHCRSPLDFLMTDWREGADGALFMGLRHGAFCLGCCWALMCLLFVAGVMNLLWVAAITAFVLIEKVVPSGHWVGRVAGLGLIAWGVTMAATSFS